MQLKTSLYLAGGSTVGYAPGDVVAPNYATVLREATLPLQTDNQCNANLGNSYISSSMLCAAPQGGGIDACQGDSGGPLMYNDGGSWKQIGIVSWGAGCATAGQPGVYTRIASFDDWIENFINGISIDKQLTFTTTKVNESATQTLTVSNNAATEAQLTFTVTGSSDFSLDTQTCNTIAANTSCAISVVYSPSTTLTTQVQLTIESDLIDSSAVTTTVSGIPYTQSSSSSGGGSLLFIFSIPLLVLRRYFTK